MEQPHVTRMREELTELSIRINKLAAFIMTNNQFKGLPLQKRTLMERQLDAMRCYQYFLAKRLDLEIPGTETTQ